MPGLPSISGSRSEIEVHKGGWDTNAVLQRLQTCPTAHGNSSKCGLFSNIWRAIGLSQRRWNISDRISAGILVSKFMSQLAKKAFVYDCWGRTVRYCTPQQPFGHTRRIYLVWLVTITLSPSFVRRDLHIYSLSAVIITFSKHQPGTFCHQIVFQPGNVTRSTSISHLSFPHDGILSPLPTLRSRQESWMVSLIQTFWNISTRRGSLFSVHDDFRWFFLGDAAFVGSFFPSPLLFSQNFA